MRKKILALISRGVSIILEGAPVSDFVSAFSSVQISYSTSLSVVFPANPISFLNAIRMIDKSK